jgi:hypothetical protein
VIYGVILETTLIGPAHVPHDARRESRSTTLLPAPALRQHIPRGVSTSCGPAAWTAPYSAWRLR